MDTVGKKLPEKLTKKKKKSQTLFRQQTLPLKAQFQLSIIYNKTLAEEGKTLPDLLVKYFRAFF